MKCPKPLARHLVRKTWLLYCQWQKSDSEVDKNIYLAQRSQVERAVAGSTWAEEILALLP